MNVFDNKLITIKLITITPACSECGPHLNSPAVCVQGLHGEVHTDRVPLLFGEHAGLETPHHARFTDADISGQNYCED